MSAVWITGGQVDGFARDHLAGRPDVHVPDCRCGGAPMVRDAGTNGSGPYRIQCERCGIRTGESTCFAGPLDTWTGVMR